MNWKMCVYRNCGNTSTTTQVTFFSFPLKDTSKCEKWARLAGCDGINLKNKFLCENHFNTIYISRTPRRTILLPNAMPYGYNGDSIQNDNFDDDFNCTKPEDDLLVERLDDGDNGIYSEPTADIAIVEEQQSADDEEEIDDSYQQIEKKSNNIKHEKNKTYHDASAVTIKKFGGQIIANLAPNESTKSLDHAAKKQKLQSSPVILASKNSNEYEQTSNEMNATNDNINVIDNKIDDPNITTFIFQGEEYIQMPKRIYLQQRAKLEAELKRFENILRDVKALVND